MNDIINNMIERRSIRSVGSCMVARAEDAFSSELGRRLQKEWALTKPTGPQFM
jgi:hypothetical protein